MNIDDINVAEQITIIRLNDGNIRVQITDDIDRFGYILVNSAGKILKKQNVNGNDVIVNCEGCSRGIYLIVLDIEGKTITRKVAIN